MAKKILYKITAYHCPKCGSTTDPNRKYCEYCSRDLNIRSENRNFDKFRLLVDHGNYIYYDGIKNIEFASHNNLIDVTTLDDSRRYCIQGNPTRTFTVDIPFTTNRGIELLAFGKSGVHNIRLEHLGYDMSYETQAYLTECNTDIFGGLNNILKLKFMSYGDERHDTAIPREILEGFRCPNCGAPVKSRYGACDYCSGYSEVEW